MPSRLVGGLVLPVKVAYHPALELCNTRAWWGADEPKEYLLTSVHALVLAEDLGILLPPGDPPARRRARRQEEGTALEDLLQLRDDLYATVTGVASERIVRRLDAFIRTGRGVAEFRGLQEGTPLWAADDTDPARALHAFARAAGALAMSAHRVGACPRCGWVFLDRTGRRKWCSMQWCGNRAKAQRFAERAKHAPPHRTR